MNATLEIPAAVPQPKAAKVPKSKILLVDDNTPIRHILHRLLEEENYLVLPAANGVEALKLASTTKFDLALLDLNLSVTEGWKIFDQISAKNPLLPIILVTARPSHYFHALASGVSGLLERPLDFVKLFHTIRNLLVAPSEARPALFTGITKGSHLPPESEV